MNIQFVEAEKLKTKPDIHELGFGKKFTDYMFVMDYEEGKGWINPRIVPYGPISLDPCCAVLHYGQELFEGLKAYINKDGKVVMFRPTMNAKRFNNSGKRMCIPAIPEEDFVQAINDLVKVEQAWIPEGSDTSLYIRPFVFATDAALGVHPSPKYTFMVILSPSGAYYGDKGLDAVKILIEDEFVRAVRGGTGFTKCGGNYAGSLIAQRKANELGFNQVLWLDGVEMKYIEEVGAMNVMFKIDGKIVTPSLTGTILPGITRDSCITLLKHFGYEVEERRLSCEELMECARNGKLEEAWGTGTAAVVSPIGILSYKGETVTISQNKIGPVTEKLYNELTGIQRGKKEDIFNWVYFVK